MKTTILLVGALLCLNFSVTAQQKHSAFKVGAKLPDSIWQYSYKLINNKDGKFTTSLKEYEGKLIILDFWASWCGSCLAKFPELDSLQAQFKDRLVILLVNSINTKDKLEHMQKVLTGAAEETKQTQLNSIINDKMLMNLFPHQYLPHYVWIGAKGDVLAITPAEFVNATNIEQLLPTTKLTKP